MMATNTTATCPDCGATAGEGTACACQARRVLRFVAELQCGHCARTIGAVILPAPRAPILVPRGLRCRWCGGPPQPGEILQQVVYPTLPRIAPRVGRPPRWLQEQLQIRTECLMTNFQHPLIGARVYVDDNYYAGEAIVLEYDPSSWNANERDDRAGHFYCHLLDVCLTHEDGVDEACDDPNDKCMGDICRGWYAIREEGS